MAISAKDVMELRKQTDCGMMECKKALTELTATSRRLLRSCASVVWLLLPRSKPRCCRGYGLR